jgi:hypothetical protein
VLRGDPPPEQATGAAGGWRFYPDGMGFQPPGGRPVLQRVLAALVAAEVRCRPRRWSTQGGPARGWWATAGFDACGRRCGRCAAWGSRTRSSARLRAIGSPLRSTPSTMTPGTLPRCSRRWCPGWRSVAAVERHSGRCPTGRGPAPVPAARRAPRPLRMRSGHRAHTPGGDVGDVAVEPVDGSPVSPVSTPVVEPQSATSGSSAFSTSHPSVQAATPRPGSRPCPGPRTPGPLARSPGVGRTPPSARCRASRAGPPPSAPGAGASLRRPGRRSRRT